MALNPSTHPLTLLLFIFLCSSHPAVASKHFDSETSIRNRAVFIAPKPPVVVPKAPPISPDVAPKPFPNSPVVAPKPNGQEVPGSRPVSGSRPDLKPDEKKSEKDEKKSEKEKKKEKESEDGGDVDDINTDDGGDGDGDDGGSDLEDGDGGDGDDGSSSTTISTPGMYGFLLFVLYSSSFWWSALNVLITPLRQLVRFQPATATPTTASRTIDAFINNVDDSLSRTTDSTIIAFSSSTTPAAINTQSTIPTTFRSTSTSTSSSSVSSSPSPTFTSSSQTGDASSLTNLAYPEWLVVVAAVALCVATA